MKSIKAELKVKDSPLPEQICAPEKAWFSRWLHLIGNKLNLSQWSYFK